MRGRERHVVVDTAFRIAIYGLVASLVARDAAMFVWLLQGLLLVSAAVSAFAAYRAGELLAPGAFTRYDQAAWLALVAFGVRWAAG